MNRQEVFETLKIDEGVEYKVYADHLGLHTFGVGHLITNQDPEWGQPFETPVSEERVWEAFDQDLNIAIAECHHLFPGDEFEGFPEEAQQVIVNMMFNMGRPRLSGFKKFIASKVSSLIVRRTSFEKLSESLMFSRNAPMEPTTK